MKKKIIAIVAVILVVAIGVGAYFLFSGDDSNSKVTAVKEDFMENNTMLEAIILQPERYQEKIGDEYEMSEEIAANFIECPENWLMYEQLITIYNNSEENITVYGFEVEGNGKNDVYVSTSTGGELSIAPGGHGPATYSILCENGDLSEDEAKELAEKITVKIIYSKTPTEYDDSTESVEETKVAVVETAK